uniref:Synaptotagmin 6 n=1 Tax=Cyclopterus lumpus TaxID=8103 RepID=A0A8C2WW87_CYCLU
MCLQAASCYLWSVVCRRELWDPLRGASFGLLLCVFVICGLAVLGLLTFISWKLCLVPWRTKAHFPSPSLQPAVTMATEKVKDPMGSMGFLEAAVKISRTSPDIPTDVQISMREHFLRRTQRMQRQATEPASSTRLVIYTHLRLSDNDEKPTGIGRIQPELYQQKALESEDSSKNSSSKNCGRINFSLKYDYENEALIVNILRASDLPAKDLCGTSDPYVKVYLLPDRKKFQTRVHRKMLNPSFDESFQFPVPYDELAVRKLHMSVFDFDRFSRHDMIGEVVLENLFETSDLSRETNIWRDIQYATSVRIY